MGVALSDNTSCEREVMKRFFWMLVAATALLVVLMIYYCILTQPSAAGEGAELEIEQHEQELVTPLASYSVTPPEIFADSSSQDKNATALVQTNIVTNESSSLQKLHWTSLYSKDEEGSYHFFSAYYDDRASAPNRPAVFVMGYSNGSSGLNFYCMFKYSNGKEVCRTTLTASRHPSGCFAPMIKAKPQHFFCRMKPGEESPVSVRLSTSNGCEPQFTSGEIPVQNRKHVQPTKKFGVCVGGPLVQIESHDILDNLIQFIEASRLLGAEFIVLYVNETQINEGILEYLWKHYPDTVRTIGWKRFEKWSPLHYFGQLLIISDCYYRVMYEVENLALIDIDEMIWPVKHNNWYEMVHEFKTRKDVSIFKFQHAFFDDPNPLAQTEERAKLQTNPSQSNRSLFIPKYFTHTRRYKCFTGYSYRTKMMATPRFIVEPSIHSICNAVAQHAAEYHVPPELGILAHYREPIPDDCKKTPTFTDKLATKFKDRLNRRMQDHH